MLIQGSVDADYGQFYIYSGAIRSTDTSHLNRESMQRGIGVCPNFAAIFCARQFGSMDVQLEVCDAKPIVQLDYWNHVVECSISFDADRLYVTSWDEYGPKLEAKITPGIYRLRMCGKNLDEASNPPEGSDTYLIQIWPEKELAPVTLKQWAGYTLMVQGMP